MILNDMVNKKAFLKSLAISESRILLQTPDLFDKSALPYLPNRMYVNLRHTTVQKGHCLTSISEHDFRRYLLIASSEVEIFTDSKDLQQNILTVKWMVKLMQKLVYNRIQSCLFDTEEVEWWKGGLPQIAKFGYHNFSVVKFAQLCKVLN